MPTEPRLLKPQSAYVAMATERGRGQQRRRRVDVVGVLQASRADEVACRPNSPMITITRPSLQVRMRAHLH